MKGKMGSMQLGEENMTSASEYKGINDEKCNITKVRLHIILWEPQTVIVQ